MCFTVLSVNLSHFVLPTFSSLLSLFTLQLKLPHDSGGGGDGGGRGQDCDTGGYSRGDFVRPEAPSNQLEVDCLAGVSEHFDGLLIGVSLDIYTIDLQRSFENSRIKSQQKRLCGQWESVEVLLYSCLT